MTKRNNMFSMNSIEFFADFFMVPVFIIFMMHYNQASILFMVSLILTGMILWTLVEYIMHRYLFHNTWLFKEQHDDHHRKPKALIGNAPWMTFVSTLGLWTSIWALFDGDTASALTSGILVGYLIYSSIHVKLHHGDPKTFTKQMARLYRHHSAHHRGGSKNFGVTTDWWDRICGTVHKDR